MPIGALDGPWFCRISDGATMTNDSHNLAHNSQKNVNRDLLLCLGEEALETIREVRNR